MSIKTLIYECERCGAESSGFDSKGSIVYHPKGWGEITLSMDKEAGVSISHEIHLCTNCSHDYRALIDRFLKEKREAAG